MGGWAYRTTRGVDTSKNQINTALAGVAQWIECRPVNQKITSLIPSQGTWPGLQAGSLVGGV